MYAVIQWNHNDITTPPMVIAENITHEQAEVIARMNVNLYHREIITKEDLEDMRKP